MKFYRTIDSAIDNVVKNIKGKYDIITNTSLCKNLRCDAVLKGKYNKEYYPIYLNDSGFFKSGVGMDKMYKAVKDWVEAMETEPGELFAYQCNVEDLAEKEIKFRLVGREMIA